MIHNAPSPRSLGRGYAPAGLDALVDGSAAALWIHGHTHRCCDYRIGDTG